MRRIYIPKNFPVPVLTFVLGLIAGAYLRNIISTIITIAFLILLVMAAFYIWNFFNQQKGR